jgi:PhoPQ-activated pathogenicity-related protein
VVTLCVWACLACALPATTARAGLDEYLARPEPKFAWKVVSTDPLPAVGGTVTTIELTSQTWQGIDWTHKLLVFRPAGVEPNATMLLVNTGGGPGPASALVGATMAQRIGAPVAILFNIPNQPLFDDLREDALISETFVRYLTTKDENWPLLFPMAKSVAKSMDALQAFTEAEWKRKATRFVVSGASKRGWTSWMIAAGKDSRVVGIVPMVIDTLNMAAQMPRQVAHFGKPSDMIRDYTQRGLVPIPKTPEGTRLWQMVDPWTYRDRLTLPKLIVNGTNDPYWTLDATNVYWDDLPDDKYLSYTPNAGHNLRDRTRQGTDGVSTSLNASAAFVRSLTYEDEPMPKLAWTHADKDASTLRVTLTTADPATQSAQAWVATARTRDFREAKWEPRPMARQPDGTFTIDVARPRAGFVAVFGEAQFKRPRGTFTLSTQVRLAGATPADDELVPGRPHEDKKGAGRGE